MTGWDLVGAAEKGLGNFWNITRSQVYRELRLLDERGLIESGTVGPRDRRPFTITQAGRDAFGDWISRSPAQEVIRFPLLLTVFFAEHVDPQRLERFLRLHQLEHQEKLEAYERLEERIGADQSGPALALRFGLEYERAVLRWFGSLPWLAK